MPTVTPSANLWDSVKSDFKSLFPEDVFKLWFEPIVCLEATEDLLTLGVPNDFAAIWINDNYLDLIVQRLRLTTGRAVSVKLKKADLDTSSSPFAQRSVDLGGDATRAKPAPARRTVRYDERTPGTGALNLRNTFESLVVGKNNQMAHAAALGTRLTGM